jgi:RND family efflux transporter MFP subunit
MADADLSSLKIDKATMAGGTKRTKGRIWWAGIIVVLIAVIALLFFTGIITPSYTVQASRVTHVYPTQSLTVLNSSGYIVAQRKSAVAAKITGRLIWLGVEEGSKVSQNQVIARLESADVEASRDQAQANIGTARGNLDQAKAELSDATLALERAKILLAKGFIAKSDHDAAFARYEKAQAALKSAESVVRSGEAALKGAQVALEYTLIRAPFNAVVLTKNADVGDIVTPLGAAANAKASVVTVADMESLKVEADVSESNVGLVKTGQPCEIQLDALPGSRFRGKVHTIIPTADRTKATVLVKVGFVDTDRRILPEMSAKVAFLRREPATSETQVRTAVSKVALTQRSGATVLFILRNGKAWEMPVQVGNDLGDMVEIIKGAASGDQVVMNPPSRLKSGATVKVAEK